MIFILTRILVTAVALLLAAHLIPGVVVTGWYPAIIAALILGLLNVTVKPVLAILTFPITFLTLGLFIFVINALLFMFAASFISGFTVSSFGTAFLASLFVTVFSTIVNKII